MCDRTPGLISSACGSFSKHNSVTIQTKSEMPYCDWLRLNDV
jgi:hypothetical protein